MFPNLEEVVGMELSAARYSVGERALERLALLFPADFRVLVAVPGHEIAVLDTRNVAVRVVAASKSVVLRGGGAFARHCLLLNACAASLCGPLLACAA
jgi:hypothetical protein